jgi:hypothetical protein
MGYIDGRKNNYSVFQWFDATSAGNAGFQKELYNFDSLYTFIQRTGTVFSTVIM